MSSIAERVVSRKSLKSLRGVVSADRRVVFRKPLIENEFLERGVCPLSIDRGACAAPLSDNLVEQGEQQSTKPSEGMERRLHNLADRVRRLVPSHRNPDAFHEEKSEIEAELRRLAASESRKPCTRRGQRVLPQGSDAGRAERETSSDLGVLDPKLTRFRRG